MAARMEGWDGTPACQSSSDCGGNDCIQGICQGEVQQCTINDDCDYLDNLPCVDGVCNAGICEVSYTTNSCDDGIGCTENDICSLGSCTAGILNNSLCPENPDCEISTCTVGGCEYSNCNSSVGDEVFSLLFDSDIDDSIGGLIGITNSSPADGERGFSFDGISNYVQYGDNLNLDFPLSIASWVYLRDTTKNPIFFSDGGTTEHDGYWLYHANGKLELGYGNGGSGSVTANRDSFTTQENINLNQWVHVVGIINDSRDMQIYIDGVEVSTSETGYSESYQYSNGPVTIGRRTSSSGSNNYLTGFLEDLRVYNRALSASEVSDLFNGVVIEPECNNDNECNHLDNDFCFGTEIRHTEGICNDLFECEAQTSLVEDCNDGEFCNGEESCNLASCIDGTSPILDDEISCTVDSCDEINDLIVNTPNDSLCNNNLVCDGVETCDALNGCQDGIQIDCSGSDLVSIGTCFNNPDGIDWTWDFRNTFTSTCQEPSGSCTTGDSTITHDCDIIACGADCELNTDCAPTDCDVQDGCVGNDYYDYTNVDNDCLNDCSCESNSCGTPNIILNSPLCVACTTNEDCNGLNQDFCFGTEIRHTEGICNALFECEAQTTIVEDCAIQDNSYCSGLDIMRDIYTCNTAICEISETILEESCDDGDDTTIDECSPEGCNHTSTIIPQNQFVNINDGWNTFSLNINASLNSNDLDSLFVLRYENNSWEMDVDSLSGDEFEIEPLRGYFVYSNENKEINFSGYALPQSYDYELVSGTWNLISVLNDGAYDIPNQGLYYINPINLESNELQSIELESGNVYWVDTGASYGPPGQVLGGFWNGLFDTIKRILF